MQNLDVTVFPNPTADLIAVQLNDLTKLRNYNKRGFRKYHLDHIFPISQGFKENISPDVIGNIKNLQFIHYRKNIKKKNDITEESIKLINDIIKEIKICK